MTGLSPTDWKERLEDLLDAKPIDMAMDYTRADVETIERALAGLGPEDKAAAGASGACMVVNLSSAHVPDFCATSAADGDKPYKNGYDLGRLRIGAEPARMSRRERLDSALAQVMGCAAHEIYYGAVELNGTGVHFYGDICLVLKHHDAQAHILDRNSYDLFRAPLSTTFSAADSSQLLERVNSIAGAWHGDLPRIAALKIIPTRSANGRRITTGDISDGLLSDEDYIEVLRRGSFSAGDLQEARITAADAARESHILDRELRGPTPSAAAQVWAQQRRAAERALAQTGVSVRTVTESGRVKS